MDLSADGNVLRLAGVIDFDNADACRLRGLALLERMPAEVVADLAGLASASSVTVAVLLHWARHLAARGGRLRLAHVPEKCQAILRVSGLTEALPAVS